MAGASAQPPDTTTAFDGIAPTAQSLASAARRHLGMDLAFIAEFSAGRRVFRFVDAAPGAVRLDVGTGDELADTYCEQIIRGITPGVIPDTAAEPTVRELDVTSRLGIASYVGVPVRYADGRVFGTFCCLSHATRPDLGPHAERYLAVLAETMAAELESAGRGEEERSAGRRRVATVIDERRFRPVFQPIVDLTTGRIVGAEALTRFTDDDRSPMAWFAEASTVGLGPELELAALHAALEAFGDVDDDVYVAVNLSPSAVVELPQVLDGRPAGGDGLVVELTEHTEVADYETLGEVLATLRSRSVRLAVDDTGAGVSSLRHVLELRPDIIKLDVSLTRDIATDPVRKALVGALAGFGQEVEASVVAEGIERADQLETLVALGIGFGQGYHLGAPAPLPLSGTPAAAGD